MTEKFADDFNKKGQRRPERASSAWDEISDGIDEWEDDPWNKQKDDQDEDNVQEPIATIENAIVSPPEDSYEFEMISETKEKSFEELKSERILEICEELIKEWEEKNGPMDRPMTKFEIEGLRSWEILNGKTWDGKMTRMTDEASEFYFDHRGNGKSSIPSRAEKILIERYPEYAALSTELDNGIMQLQSEIEMSVAENVDEVPSEWEEVPTEEAKDLLSNIKSPDSEQLVTFDQESKLSPEQIEKAEYLRLKREFKESQEAYYDALEKDYADRNIAKKIFGIGRGSMNSEVQSAYDAFMASNKAYYEYAKTSGTYQKIAERLNRENQADDEQISVMPLVAERHVLTPAKERLEIQSTLLPEKMRALKASLLEKIKVNPDIAKALGYVAYGYTAYRIFNAPAAIAGMAVNYTTGKIANRLENFSEDVVFDKMTGKDFDLEKLEAEYFDNIRFTQGLRTVGKIGAVATTMGVGGAFGNVDDITDRINSIPDNLPTAEDVSQIVDQLPTRDDIVSGIAELHEQSNDLDQTVIQPEIKSAIESTKEFVSVDVPAGIGMGEAGISEAPVTERVIESIKNIELKHTVESGENTSTILFNAIKEKVSTGEIVLPKGVDVDHLSHYMYQNFPELTNATGVEAKLTPQDWIDVGVKSGNPHEILPGQDIDVGALLEKLRVHPVDNVSADVVTGTHEVPTPVFSDRTPDLSTTQLKPEIPIAAITPEAQIPTGTETVLNYDSSHLNAHYLLNNHDLPINTFSQQWSSSIDFNNLKLPEGFDRTNIKEFLGKTFPEMVGLKSGEAATLAPEYWKFLGISSGNPLEINYGDTLNLKKMYDLAVSWPQTEGKSDLQEALLKEIFKEELKNIK